MAQFRTPFPFVQVNDKIKFTLLHKAGLNPVKRQIKTLQLRVPLTI